MYYNLEPVEYEAEEVGYAGLEFQQGADKDGSDREAVAGGDGGQGPGHPHLTPLYLPPGLQHSSQVRRSSQPTVLSRSDTYEFSFRNELDLG